MLFYRALFYGGRGHGILLNSRPWGEANLLFVRFWSSLKYFGHITILEKHLGKTLCVNERAFFSGICPQTPHILGASF